MTRCKRCRHKRWMTLAISLLALAGAAIGWAGAGHVHAQTGSRIAYGETVTGSLTSDAAPNIYTFTGATGDHVEVDVLVIDGDLAPVVSLLSVRQTSLASSDHDPFSAQTTDARLDVRLPADGTYSLMVGRVDGSGEYLLRLRGRQAATSTHLQPGVLTQAAVVPESSQLFTFDTAACDTTFIAATRTRTATGLFPFILHIYDDSGATVTTLRGGDVLENRLNVAAASGVYTVEVTGTATDQPGLVTLLVDCAGNMPGSGSGTAVRPLSTPDAMSSEEDASPANQDTPADDTAANGDAGETGADAATAEPTEEATPIPAPPPDCGDFRLASPREGLPNGPVTVYWNAAPSAASYAISVFNEAGDIVLNTGAGAEATSAVIDVSSRTIGTGFYFTLEVTALDLLGRPICADSSLQGREPPPPLPPGE